MISEIAQPSLSNTVIEASYAAARDNPDLKVVCPWCGESRFGREFSDHADTHRKLNRITAIILAGGKGSRLAPWIAPKCLMPVNGVPVLHRLLSHLFGFEVVGRAIICTGYRANDVEAAISNSWSISVTSGRIAFSNAGEDAPMGERLFQARKLFGDDTVLVCYGDELADVDVKALADDQNTMAFAATPHAIPGGAVIREGDRWHVLENQPRLVNIGFVRAKPECWSTLTASDGVSDWINRTSVEQSVGLLKHHGKRATINSLADLKYAEEVWR